MSIVLLYPLLMMVARSLWETTKNTVGFNHMIASASDAASGGGVAYVMETMYNYTAYFADNDPRYSQLV